MADADDIRKSVLDFLARERGGAAQSIAETENLLQAGHLDSTGFIKLLMHLEAATGREVDFLAIDPKELASIDGLVRFFGSAELPRKVS